MVKEVASSNVSSSGGISALLLEGSWLFAGFDGPSGQYPECSVGGIRAWNLDNANAPPYEFYISETMLCSHSHGVSALAFATINGQPTLFSGSIKGDIHYWQLDTSINMFKCLGNLEGHLRSVTRLKTVNLGSVTLLLTASLEGSIKVYDLSTLKVITVLSGHQGGVTDLEIWVNGNESFLISCGMDKNVIVWNLTAPFAQVFEEKQSHPVMCLCGVQDTKQVPILLVGLQNGDVVVKELPTFKYKTVLSYHANFGHSDAVRRIAKGPLNTFFTGGEDRRVYAWQITDSVDTIPSK